MINIAHIYESQLGFVFKDHPRGKFIVNAILKNQLTTQEIDLVFLEADHYGWEALLRKPLPPANKDGIVTFKLRR